MTSLTQPLTSKPLAAPIRRLRHIRELDGLRGVAALLVFFHHLCFTSVDPAGWAAPIRGMRAIFQFGESGVDVFFVLSGFLITSLLIDAPKSESYYKDFYWKRALRILPLYVVCLLGVLYFIPNSKSYVILCALFVSNFANVFHVQNAGPFWTLAIEEQFYLLWPTIVRRRSIQQLRQWSLAIGWGAILLRLVAACFGHYNYRPTFFHCDGLAFGAYLACWYAQRDSSQPGSPGERRTIAGIFLAGLLLFALSFLPSHSHLQLEALRGASYQTGVTFLSCSLVAYLIGHAGQKKVSWFRSPLVTFFGLISYAMYMIHTYVMGFYDGRFGVLRPGDNAAYAIRILSVLGITVVFCLLARYLIELPAASLRKYVLAKPRV
jgi:peptidoglycan/LPS O-acetylase OafA/YrhL